MTLFSILSLIPLHSLLTLLPHASAYFEPTFIGMFLFSFVNCAFICECQLMLSMFSSHREFLFSQSLYTRYTNYISPSLSYD